MFCYEVDKPSKILTKILSAMEYIEVLCKEFLKLFKCLASSDIHTIFKWLDLSNLLPREKEKKIDNPHQACMGA